MNNTDIKKETKRRINIMKGHLDALAKMIQRDRPCKDLLDQSLAIQSSLKSLDTLIIERHLKIHVLDQFKDKDKAIIELLEVFKREKKND